jgi:hypothetical protein
MTPCRRKRPTRRQKSCDCLSFPEVVGISTRFPRESARVGRIWRMLKLVLRVVVSSGSVMRSIQEGFRHYPMFRHRSATPAGVTGNGVVRSLGDNVASISGSAGNA